MLSDICNFYSGKSIFITGATGYLGKVCDYFEQNSNIITENTFMLY